MKPKMGRMVIGVNSLSRETGLPRQTISARMRRGQTADQIRLYAALREGRTTQRSAPSKTLRVIKVPPAKRVPTQMDESEAILRGRAMLEAIEDAKLRRAKALAIRQEFANTQRRVELIPVRYLSRWGKRLLP